MVNQAPSSARARIRPIQVDDRDGLSVFYARLSPGSRFARFHAMSRGIGDEAATILCGPDHEHCEGFVAEPVDADASGRSIIIGHICLEPDELGIEMAVAVADDWQRHGIGRSLLLAGVDWARSQGIARLHASALSTNSAVIGLIASIGRPVRESSSSAGVVLTTIDIGGTLPRAA